MKKILISLLMFLASSSVAAQTGPGSIQPPGVTTALSAVTTNTNSSPINVRLYGAIALDVTITGGTVNVTLKGRIDTASTYRTLLGYNDADGTSLSTITASGSYTYGTAGKEDVEVFTTSISGATVTVKVRPIPSVGKAFHDGEGGGGGGSGTVTSVSGVDTNGFTFNITNPTTTPGITIAAQNAVADGATKGFATFTAVDFNASSGNISLDYTNAQKATGSVPGFLAAADWTTFNNKQAALGFTPVGGSGTANSLPKFTAGTTLGNSSLTDDGTTITSTERLSLGGGANASGIITTGTATIIGDGANVGNGTYIEIDDTEGIIEFQGTVVIQTLGPVAANQHAIQNVASSTFALYSNKLSVFAATTSAELAGVLSDETGSGGGFVRATTPTIATPSFTTGFTIAGAASSGKIITGNGTNYVASAYTVASPGTSGNVLTSDGTNWTSAAPAGGGLTIGTTTIASGTSTRIPFELSGVLREDADLTFATDTLTATKIVAPTSVTTDQLTVSITGSTYGIDFNGNAK